MQMGFATLGIGLLVAILVIWGFRTGRSLARIVAPYDRYSEPVRFWLGQLVMTLFSTVMFYFAINIFLQQD
jgi:hypothetical protein